MKNELYHHGIDGQRWGVTHGPPYPLSRAQHRAVVRSAKATEKRNLSYKGSKKYSHRMSDEDLNKTIERLQKEETYRRLVSKDKEESKKSNAKDASNTIKKYVGQTIGKGVINVSDAAFKKLISTLFPEGANLKWTKVITRPDGTRITLQGDKKNAGVYVGNLGMIGSTPARNTQGAASSFTLPEGFDRVYVYDPNNQNDS